MKTPLFSSAVTATPPIAFARLARSLAALICAAFAFVAQLAGAAVTEAWVQRYDGAANASDQPSSLAVDGSGRVAVTGTSFNGTDWDYYTAKYAAGNGALLWEQRYNGLGNGHDYGQAVAVDSIGNVVVTGSSYKSIDDVEYYTVKYAAADGAILWAKHYSSSSYAAAIAVAVDSIGNVVVTGSSFEPSSDYYTAKYAAADGALIWEHRYNNLNMTDDYARALAVDSSDNVVVTGQSRLTTGSVCYTAKYAAADGALLWEKPGNGNDGRRVVVDGSGNVVVMGTAYDRASGTDYYTAKYAAADGALLWERYYNGPENGQDTTGGVAVDASGNVVVTGSSYYNGTYSYMAKYAAADGALLWEKRSSAFPAHERMPVAVDAGGNVVVAGGSSNGSNSDFYTAKYAAADGALLWEKSYHGSANGFDSVSSLALGPNGMVAITGSSYGSSPDSADFATVVYWESLPEVSIELVPTGVRLHFTGVPGSSYNIERAPAVTGPWSTIARPTALLDGLIEYVDSSPPTDTAFYRTSTP